VRARFSTPIQTGPGAHPARDRQMDGQTDTTTLKAAFWNIANMPKNWQQFVLPDNINYSSYAMNQNLIHFK
jgi:hypothetical protein